ncbi:MAG TPA: indole-3-glycerol phosphate synthase TrpC [Longimicrobiaceae bacterium]|nr:indole-3-glycerol phosphate synthase TrpC [Longimicrobiaceae bacterium]
MNIPEAMPKGKENSISTTQGAGRDILAVIVDAKRREVEGLRPRREELLGRARDASPPRGFAAALRVPTEVRLLAEIKRRSPSAGIIRGGADPAGVARAYERAGAGALSVLTDGEFFGGDLGSLTSARAAVALPVLRKDFVIDPIQLFEARGAGADAVLLIVRILEDEKLVELSGISHELGMDCLVEVHDADEMERALAADTRLIGVNNRDLSTFHTDLSVSLGLAAAVPPDITLVSESGIRTAEDVERLGAAGVDAVLVGESLMVQPDVGIAAAALVGHQRQPRAGR